MKPISINERISLDMCDDLGDNLVTVEYFKAFQEVLIVNSQVILNIPYEKVPALISMLQSICGVR